MKGENYETGIFGGNDFFGSDRSGAPPADSIPSGGDRGEYDGANVDECSGVSIYGWIGDSFVAREPEKVAGKSRGGIGITLGAVFDFGIAMQGRIRPSVSARRLHGGLVPHCSARLVLSAATERT